ncbi:unnamed protein product [Orchesella dallaii]|uniref:Uncharacterized protein n=1 Tax=Orchesella dallaii TaxID=48710 RepID=A0ABP1RDS8_9HEXA
MEPAARLRYSFLLLAVVILCCEAYPGIPLVEQEFIVEGYQRDGETQTIVLRIRPNNAKEVPALNRKARQFGFEEEEEEVPSTTPYIPAVIPGLTKIFTGLLTGNLNEIFHGSTSFAPQNVSHAIDSVYNQVVGLPPPQATPPTSRRPLAAEPTAAPAAQASAGQPLAATQASATTVSSNEDDEDESEGLGFGRKVLKQHSDSRF